jgi:hypothetical protein
VLYGEQVCKYGLVYCLIVAVLGGYGKAEWKNKRMDVTEKAYRLPPPPSASALVPSLVFRQPRRILGVLHMIDKQRRLYGNEPQLSSDS